MANDALLALTADIVTAHVANNHISGNALPELIATVHSALSGLGKEALPLPDIAKPAVSIRSSVKQDHIVCLEDGAKLKMLRRYIKTKFDLTPEQYRTKWGLPKDYPMVAPDYAEMRRTLAKSIGLGRKRLAAPPEVVIDPIAKAAKATRKAATKVEEVVEDVTGPIVEAAKAGRKKLGIFAAKAAAVAHLSAAPEAQPAPRAKRTTKGSTKA